MQSVDQFRCHALLLGFVKSKKASTIHLSTAFYNNNEVVNRFGTITKPLPHRLNTEVQLQSLTRSKEPTLNLTAFAWGRSYLKSFCKHALTSKHAPIQTHRHLICELHPYLFLFLQKKKGLGLGCGLSLFYRFLLYPQVSLWCYRPDLSAPKQYCRLGKTSPQFDGVALPAK